MSSTMKKRVKSETSKCPKKNGKPFKCSQCSYRAKQKGVIKRHEAHIHSDERPFSCRLCPYKAKSAGNLHNHMKIHSGVRPHKCQFPNCGYGSIYKNDLTKHIRIHTGERPFGCKLCHKKFAQKPNLLHIRTHTGERPYKCQHPDCELAFKSSRDLKKHQVIHTREMKFFCPICDYKTRLKSHFSDHMRTHDDIKCFACSLCPYLVKVYYGCIKKHMIHVHGLPVDVRPQEKTFKCELIGAYEGTTKSKLQDHFKSQSEEKPFYCDQCTYRSKQFGNLKLHLRTHNGEKPYPCVFCDYKGSTSQALRDHFAKHTGEKCHKCQFCDYSTAYSSSMKIHIIKTHNNNNNNKKPVGRPRVTHKKNGECHKLKVRNDQRSPGNEEKIILTCKLPGCEFCTVEEDQLAIHLNTHQLPFVLLTRPCLS